MRGRFNMSDNQEIEKSRRVDELNERIRYIEGHITSCELYPTDTTQFRQALDREREELRGLYEERNRLTEELEDSGYVEVFYTKAEMLSLIGEIEEFIDEKRYHIDGDDVVSIDDLYEQLKTLKNKEGIDV
jgi:hypothetical protein